MRWIAATVCVFVVLGLGYLYWTRNVLRTNFAAKRSAGRRRPSASS